ncbi:MAG TPA: CvpA family protein [Isosphaeraceae bacterium]|jgi:uncharacterized membrane protein required for colicin V production|nr:CvpA family protein [Isosphaeraceae bacterium]
MTTIIDLIIVGFVLGLTYVLTSEGLWGAALMFFNVLFGAMIAFNFYEPLAKLIDSTGIGWGFSDTLCMLGLFCVSTALLKMTTETIAPAMVRFPAPVYHVGRLIFGAAGALVTVAFVLLAFHTAPVHKKIFTAVTYNSKPPFGLGLDHQFLGFFQYQTGAVFTMLGSGQRDPHHQYGHGGAVKMFDPRARWLLDHQDARPYGDEMVLTPETAAPEAGGAQQPGGAPGPGGQRGPGGRPPG